MRKNSYCSVIWPQVDSGCKSKLTSSSLEVTQGLTHFDSLKTLGEQRGTRGVSKTRKGHNRLERGKQEGGGIYMIKGTKGST